MGMTISEKILAKHCGKNFVEPGELINAKLDFILANDVTAPIAIKFFNETGAKDVFDKERIALVPDHFVPNKDIQSAAQVKIMREFARKYNIKYFFEVGEMGVEHALLPELGIVLPGDLIIGADSHTCTYGALGAFSTGVGSTDLGAAMATGEAWFKVPTTLRFNFHGDKLKKHVTGKDLILYTIGKISVSGALYQSMEFHGDIFKNLTMSDRFSISNMAIEAGGKNGIFHFDNVTKEFVEGRAKRKYEIFNSDPDAKYEKVYDFDLNDIDLQVSLPNLPENAKSINQIEGQDIDQVYIGSCTNGRIEDLRIAASILKGKEVNKNIRCIVVPATQNIYLQAMKEGLIETFIRAKAVVSTPTCGACLGGYMGILAEGERCIATTNRNFVGRMGDPKSEVYLAGPAVAAASAITGKITHPDHV